MYNRSMVTLLLKWLRSSDGRMSLVAAAPPCFSQERGRAWTNRAECNGDLSCTSAPRQVGPWGTCCHHIPNAWHKAGPQSVPPPWLAASLQLVSGTKNTCIFWRYEGSSSTDGTGAEGSRASGSVCVLFRSRHRCAKVTCRCWVWMEGILDSQTSGASASTLHSTWERSPQGGLSCSPPLCWQFASCVPAQDCTWPLGRRQNTVPHSSIGESQIMTLLLL